MSNVLDNVEERTSRSATACNACRTRKQKCGGEKPTCARCRQLNIECVWPRQQKRGPAKGYTEALEARLSETEDLLLRALSCISPEDLAKVLLVDPVDVEPASAKSSPLDRKEAVERWSKWPLKTVGDVEGWYGEQRRFKEVVVQGKGIGTLENSSAMGGIRPASILDEQNLSSICVNETRQSTMEHLAGASLKEAIPMDSDSVRSMGNDDVGLVDSAMGMATQIHDVPNPRNLQIFKTQRHQQEHLSRNRRDCDIPHVPTTHSSEQEQDPTRSTRAAGLGLTQEFRDDFLW